MSTLRLMASFNEAAAVMPRKIRAPLPSRDPGACFNEAAAVMPRKITGLRPGNRRAVAASMRPRQGCRGRFPDGNAWCALYGELQGGRGSDAAEDSYGYIYNKCYGKRFNEAAAVMPRKILLVTSTMPPLKLLQGGRGSDAAEDEP